MMEKPNADSTKLHKRIYYWAAVLTSGLNLGSFPDVRFTKAWQGLSGGRIQPLSLVLDASLGLIFILVFAVTMVGGDEVLAVHLLHGLYDASLAMHAYSISFTCNAYHSDKDDDAVPWKRWLFHQALWLRGKFAYWTFRRDACRAHSVNLDTFRRIVKDNKDTEFGRKHHFAEMDLSHDLEDWKKAVPLQSYDDISDDVARMAKGETNVLCSEDPLYYALTSSTTSSQPKLIPNTPSSSKIFGKVFGGVLPAVVSQEIPGGDDPNLGAWVFSGNDVGLRVDDGTPISPGTHEGVKRMKDMIPMLYTTPYDGYHVDDFDAQLYVHALFALRTRRMKFATTPPCPVAVRWLVGIQRCWDRLLQDIRTGRISDTIKLTDAERASLLPHLKPDPLRAQELCNSVAAQGADRFKGFVIRVWPQIRYFGTVITGSYSVHVPSLRYYIGPSLPIHSSIYVASEALVGINLWPNQPEKYVLAAGGAGFEFLPAEASTDDTVELSGLDVGKEYEVIVTNFAGLYRYRLGDVVKVTGFWQELPIMEFCYRRKELLNLFAGEKLTELQVQSALLSASKTWGSSESCVEIVNYTIMPDVQNSRYNFYVEIQGDCGAEALGGAYRSLHAELGQQNPLARLDDFSFPTIKFLKSGAFEALLKYRVSKNVGVSNNQIKVPRLV